MFISYCETNISNIDPGLVSTPLCIGGSPQLGPVVGSAVLKDPRRSMQRYRHYGTSNSSSSSAAPVEEIHAEEETEYGKEEVYEEEMQAVVQETGRTNGQMRFGLVQIRLCSYLDWFGLFRATK